MNKSPRPLPLDTGVSCLARRCDELNRFKNTCFLRGPLALVRLRRPRSIRSKRGHSVDALQPVHRIAAHRIHDWLRSRSRCSNLSTGWASVGALAFITGYLFASNSWRRFPSATRQSSRSFCSLGGLQLICIGILGIRRGTTRVQHGRFYIVSQSAVRALDDASPRPKRIPPWLTSPIPDDHNFL